MNIDPDTLKAIERNFHDVIRSRAAALVQEHNLTLPDLTELVRAHEPKAWFPVPGMYGGFSYWFEGEGPEARLVVESWCRVFGGSGQRHVITAEGSKLVEEGFV